MGGKRLPDKIQCACCTISFKPQNYKTKYCSPKCQNIARRKVKMEHPPEFKKCHKCQVVKQNNEFYRKNNSHDCLQHRCKECDKKHKKKLKYVYYRCDVCSKNIRHKGTGTARENKKARRCARCFHKQNRGSNCSSYTGSEHFAGRLISGWESSAKRRNHEWNLSKEQLDEKFNAQNGICALSGIHMLPDKSSPYRPSIDRVDSTKGYTEGNFQFVCSRVNVMKNKFDEFEFIRLCGLIYKHKGIDEKSTKE